MWKKSGIFKSIQFKIINIIAACIFICCMIGVAGGDKTIGTLDDFVVEMSGGEITEEGDYIIDASSGINGTWLTISGFKLTPGVYKYYVNYTLTAESDNDVNLIQIHSIGEVYKELLQNNPHFYSGTDSLECEFFVTSSIDTGNAYFTVDYKGTESFAINDISIIKTTGLYKIAAFFICLITLITDSLLMLCFYNKRYPFSTEDRIVYLGLPAVFLIASIPLFVNYMTFGHDYIFHVLRIEFLSKSLAQGVFPVRVEGTWLYGHGYANSIFYCDTFLMFPALLRLLGFPMLWAYQGYVYLINLLTLMVAYFSFRGIFKDRVTAVIGAMLYILSPYRFYNVYNRAAVGEYTAMIFLPLLCLGFYKIFNDDIRKKEYKYNFLILVLGLSGIIQSHLLTGEMAGAVIIVVCLTRIKKVFRKETFIELVKAVGGTVIANLWFLLPMLDMMLADEYYYSASGQRSIQKRGVFVSHLFSTIQNGGNNAFFHTDGMTDSGAIYIGVALIFGTIVYLLIRKKFRKPDISLDKMALLSLIIGIVTAAMSTIYFPWNSLKNINKILGKLASMIQFPTRLTTISTVAFVIVATTGIYWIVRHYKGSVKNAVCGLLCACAVIFSLYQANDYLYSGSGIWLYSMENMGQSNVSGGEYLLMGTIGADYLYHEAIPSDGVTVESFEKDDLDTYTYVITSDEETEHYIELPMILYKGYSVEDTVTGETLTLCKGENGDIRVMLPAGFEGTVRVWYSPMWYWHAAEAVSLCFWLCIIVWLIRRRHMLNASLRNSNEVG